LRESVKFIFSDHLHSSFERYTSKQPMIHPNYIFPSPDPLGTNKNDGAGWRRSCGEICAIIFSVPRPLLQSPKGEDDGADFQITWSGKINLRSSLRTALHHHSLKSRIGWLVYTCIMLPFSYQVQRINIGGVVSILVFFPTVIPARNSCQKSWRFLVETNEWGWKQTWL
jgi:hypothetical protein